MIVYGVDGVQAQAIDVVVAQPELRVVADEASHFVAACVVVIERLAPRRMVAISEVRTELAQVVSARSEVVVDDVQKDRHAAAMAGVDEASKPRRTPVGCVWSK